MADPGPAHVRFGVFVCDVRTGELWKGDRPIRLQEQPRQILVALLERPGELLSRDELRRRLWGDETFVAFDNALNVAVRRIREALGDTAPTARYLETVRGHGYRFIAPVSVAGPAPATIPDVTPPGRRLRPALVIVGAFVALVAVVAVLRSPAAAPGPETLAVLPFDNLLGNDDRQYLVDGLSEALTRRLAAREDVRVIARQSAVAASNRKAPVPDIARRLNADMLLVGSVAMAGAGVVINAQVVDGPSGHVRWSGRFEQSLSDPNLVDEMVDAIGRAIGSATPVPARAATRVSLEARDAYLRGRFFWAKRGQAHSVTAVGYLSTAILLQPDYAEAWAGLADVYAVFTAAPSPAIVPWPGDSVEAGLNAAREALRLAPDLGEAHAALGKLYVARRRWAEAEQSFARAVALSPQYSTARQWYGTMFSRLRRCDEALEQVEIAARLDPLTALVNESVGSVRMVCGDPRGALEVFDAVLAMHPDAHTTRHRRARALMLLERYDDAIQDLEALAREERVDETNLIALAHALAGRTARARELLAGVSIPFQRAQIFAALGETDAMFQMLERALAGEPGALQNLIGEPEFERYRYDPRFLDFASRAGFPLPLRDARFSSRVSAGSTSGRGSAFATRPATPGSG
jgi:TolB-like protein/DNA-binding winged helix-turn-helix (wHTH) protein/tetratricopeptide (TPR) repeat protein